MKRLFQLLAFVCVTISISKGYAVKPVEFQKVDDKSAEFENNNSSYFHIDNDTRALLFINQGQNTSYSAYKWKSLQRLDDGGVVGIVDRGDNHFSLGSCHPTSGIKVEDEKYFNIKIIKKFGANNAIACLEKECRRFLRPTVIKHHLAFYKSNQGWNTELKAVKSTFNHLVLNDNCAIARIYHDEGRESLAYCDPDSGWQKINDEYQLVKFDTVLQNGDAAGIIKTKEKFHLAFFENASKSVEILKEEYDVIHHLTELSDGRIMFYYTDNETKGLAICNLDKSIIKLGVERCLGVSQIIALKNKDALVVMATERTYDLLYVGSDNSIRKIEVKLNNFMDRDPIEYVFMKGGELILSYRDNQGYSQLARFTDDKNIENIKQIDKTKLINYDDNWLFFYGINRNSNQAMLHAYSSNRSISPILPIKDFYSAVEFEKNHFLVDSDWEYYGKSLALVLIDGRTEPTGATKFCVLEDLIPSISSNIEDEASTKKNILIFNPDHKTTSVKYLEGRNTHNVFLSHDEEDSVTGVYSLCRNIALIGTKKGLYYEFDFSGNNTL